MKNFISASTFASIALFLLPFAVAEDQPGQETSVKATAEAEVDVFLIEEKDGSITPLVIADASATAEVKKNTRRQQFEVQATATVDVHELSNILPKTTGDVEKILKTWYLFKTTAATAPIIESDACVCTSRYAVESCVAVKWQYSVGKDYQIISKMWGYDIKGFIYCQENINWLSAEHHIMKSIVTNVMKASVDRLIAEPCANKIDLVEYLNDVAYVLLAAEWDSFLLFKTVDNHDSITFVALAEEVYHRKDKSDVLEKVSQALIANKVDENSMKTFTKTFKVQTNSIKPQKH